MLSGRKSARSAAAVAFRAWDSVMAEGGFIASEQWQNYRKNPAMFSAWNLNS
jgi:hypothetical protein